jgi:hypothetical protein
VRPAPPSIAQYLSLDATTTIIIIIIIIITIIIIIIIIIIIHHHHLHPPLAVARVIVDPQHELAAVGQHHVKPHVIDAPRPGPRAQAVLGQSVLRRCGCTAFVCGTRWFGMLQRAFDN